MAPFEQLVNKIRRESLHLGHTWQIRKTPEQEYYAELTCVDCGDLIRTIDIDEAINLAYNKTVHTEQE